MDFLKNLTNRQEQIFALIVKGLCNKEIALLLGISENTVEQHIRSIYKKLGIRNRVEAVRLYIESNGNPL